MHDTLITISGNVAADVLQRETASGTVTKLRIAHTERKFRNGSWEDGETTFITVTCWRALAANVFASVHRGDPVIVRGRLHLRTWEQEGQQRSAFTMDAIAVGHDLSRGTGTFQRRHAAATSATAGGADWPAPLAQEAVDAGLRADSAVEVLSGAA